ncbi:transcription factor A, mitochondrial-like isoform X2 [Antedon mediterranea]|uniref:transcription factor A, mitochondrial-like isoform X2 n=1 Tax=Antedon mediterranea TaxID=105859 RepID=UPI003AF84F51
MWLLQDIFCRSPAVLLQFMGTGGAVPPKRPGNSFIQFCKETRPDIMEQNPDIPLQEIAKKLGDLWRELPEEEKHTYTQQAKDLEEQFQLEQKDFKSSLTESELEEMKVEKKHKRQQKARRREKALLKRLEKPKQPRSAFIYYVISRAPEMHEFKTDTMTKFSQDWKTLTEEEKDVFREKANADTERYKEEIEEWEERMIMEGYPEVVRKSTQIKWMKKNAEDAEKVE